MVANDDKNNNNDKRNQNKPGTSGTAKSAKSKKKIGPTRTRTWTLGTIAILQEEPAGGRKGF